MQGIVLLTLLALGAASDVTAKTQGDKTITRVVKLLQGMLDQSKKEADKERYLYGKFKCHCDTNEAERRKSMAAGEKAISLHENEIEELQGSSGVLSSQSAELDAKMNDITADAKAAADIDKKEKKAYNAQASDLTQAVKQMKDAVSTLAAVGGDQTSNAGGSSDNDQFMAGFKGAAFLETTQSRVQNAVKSVEAYMNEKQYNSMTSFMQGPFTGTYTSQSVQIVGTIKNMRDTYESDLETATRNEADRAKSYAARAKALKDAFNTAKDLYNKAQEELGENDKILATTRDRLKAAKDTYQEDDEYLNGANGKLGLVRTCDEKTADYENRVSLRTSEDAAITEAISILNSDAAFATFGTTDATSTGKTSFLQISRHSPSDDERDVVKRLLQRAAAEAGHKAPMPRMKHIISQLQKGSPFDSVFEEIDKMIEVIDEEGKADADKLGWCNSERSQIKKTAKDLKSAIKKLDVSVDSYTKEISEKQTGLNDVIADEEENLRRNHDDQVTYTTERAENNVAYQQDIKNLVAAEALLNNALNVLSAYYDQIQSSLLQSYGGAQGEQSYLQKPKKAKAPPATWDNGSFTGQKGKGGNKAIEMLEFIMKETKKEENAAHASEEKAQADFEDRMKQLKDQQSKKEKRLARLQSNLATAEENLFNSEKSLKDHHKRNDANSAYDADIKPGCDFITNNFKLRNKNRATEKTSLQNAKKSMKGSPAYKAVAAAEVAASYGTCADPCLKDKAHVKCKACMADTTVVGYCTGHKGTKGC